MNTAGVSLTAAASPINAPRGQGGRTTSMSSVTSSMSTTPTCPKKNVVRNGTVSIAHATTIAGAHLGAWRRLMHAQTAAARNDVQASTTPAAASPGSCNGHKTSAANGG